MATGRPHKFSSPEELQAIPDGLVAIKAENVKTAAFGTESILGDYIVEHMPAFVRDVLGDELVSFERERAMPSDPQKRFSPRGRRIDLYIVGKISTYLVELKNPITPGENRYAIGQLLDYGREFLDSSKKLILLTTKFDIHTAKTIEHYQLPIRYIYFDKQRILEYQSQSGSPAEMED